MALLRAGLGWQMDGPAPARLEGHSGGVAALCLLPDGRPRVRR
jgi:hypothetical protein